MEVLAMSTAAGLDRIPAVFGYQLMLRGSPRMEVLEGMRRGFDEQF
jgi:hypothetical protein